MKTLLRPSLIVLLLFCVQDSLAQTTQSLSGRIVSSLTDDKDTIDFGYIMAGDTAFVFRSVYYINDGTDSLIVRDSQFVIENWPPTMSKDEYTFEAIFPLVLRDQNAGADVLAYTLKGLSSTFLQQAPEGENLARLTTGLSSPRVGQSDSIISTRVFFLRTFKTVRPIWSEPVLHFDSVYVGAVTSAERTLVLRNSDLKHEVTVLDTSSIAFAGLRSHFSILDSPLRTLPQDSARPHNLRVQYKTSARGLDSVELAFHQLNPSVLRRGGLDTTRVLLRAVGVEQSVRVKDAMGRRTVVRNDTVDVGAFTVGAKDTIRIVIENSGNISYNSKLQISDVSPLAASKFRVVDSLHRNAKHISPGAADTLVVEFVSTEVGEYVARCQLNSDIATRVFGVPDAAKQYIFYLRGRAKPRVVSAVNVSLPFDSVSVFDQCPGTKNLALRVFNSSAQDANIISVEVQPNSAPFSFKTIPTKVAANSDAPIIVSFSPRSIGAFSGTINIRTFEDDIPLSVPVSGFGVEPRVMSLTLAENMRVFPGHQLRIPLIAEKSLVSLAQNCKATISFDSSLLKYHHYDKVSTASASASVIDIQEIKRGELRVSIEMPESFIERDTVIHLVFDSFLGYSDRTDFSVQQISFGRAPCEKVLPTTNPSSVVYLDSLCGLLAKLPRGPLPHFALGTPAPNPAKVSSKLVYRVAFSTAVRIQIMNSIGEIVSTITNGEESAGVYSKEIDTSCLPEGAYYVVMNAGIYSAMERLFVAH